MTDTIVPIPAPRRPRPRPIAADARALLLGRPHRHDRARAQRRDRHRAPRLPGGPAASRSCSATASPCSSACRRSRRTRCCAACSRASSARSPGSTTRSRDHRDRAERDDQIPPGGPIQVKDLSPQRLLVIADALAKNVALGRDEREVEPRLRRHRAVGRRSRPIRPRAGRPQADPRIIGQALLVRHRMSGRVEVEEKPDVLWDRPDLERLYARLVDEYELKERARRRCRKLDVVQRDRARPDRPHRRRAQRAARGDHRRC